MKQTANYKFNLPDDSDNIEISELNENFTKTDELIADLESENAAAHSAISDLQSGKADKAEVDKIAAPTYTMSAQRVNLTSGEKLSVAFGKIKKWFSDLKSVAFTGKYTDLSGVPEKFEPEKHTHTKSDITDFPTALKNPSSLTLTVNGSSSSYNGSSAVSKSFYAPTSSGTSGYELVSSGSGAPVWKPPNYAVCNTAGTAEVKIVSITNFKLITGVRISVKFIYEHSLASAAAKLNVNNTGAKPVIYYGNPVYGRFESRIDYPVFINTWDAGETVEFIFNGDSWIGVQKHILDPLNVLVTLPPYNHYSFAGYDYVDNITRRSDFILPKDGDASDILQEAMDNLIEGGRIILNNNDINSAYIYVDKPLMMSGAEKHSAPLELTIEATSKQTTLYFRNEGQICASGNITATLTLKHLSIRSSTLKSIINLCTNSLSRNYNRTTIILDDVNITLTDNQFGEFIEQIFVSAMNKLITNKTQILSDFELIRSTLFSTTELETEKSALEKEIETTAELMQNCIDENAHVAQNQTEYNKRYNALAEQFDKIQSRLDEVNAQITDKNARRETVELFMRNLKKQSGAVTEFDESLWLSMVDYITVNSKEDILVTFKNGTEIQA